MNTPLRRLATVVLVMFLALLGSATTVQYVQAAALSSDPRNVRTLYAEYDDARGSIVAGGTAVARSVASDDSFGYQREYPGGEAYSAVTGFYSIANGRSQLEQQANELLTGTSDQLFFTRLREILTGQQTEGASVVTTIDPAAQEAAYDALGSQQGAVVAIDPSTGAILALVSTPGYDADALAVHSTSEASAAYQDLLAADGNPLRSKATQELYPPGSTFKLITAAAALESGDYDADTEVDAPDTYTLPGTSTDLTNYGGESCSSTGTQTLAEALAVSCNTAFAEIGADLGADALREQAEAFGFGDESLDLLPDVATSAFPDDPDSAQTALAAIGQGSVTASPLQMCMVAAAIANDGELMTPYLVDQVQAADLSVVSQTDPSTMSDAVSASTAAALTQMMVGVVESGTGTAAQIDGVTVAGKTGTAETTSDAAPHAWFTGFAPADDPQVAVAVFVQNGGDLGSEATGGAVAAPIAKAVIEAVLNG